MKSLAVYATALLTGAILAAADPGDVVLQPDDPRILYSFRGGPQQILQNPAKAGDCSTPNSQMFDISAAGSLTFEGTSVVVWYYLDSMGGDSTIFVDDKVNNFNNLGPGNFGPAYCQLNSFKSGPLTPGNHTITVINTANAHIYLNSFVYTPLSATTASSSGAATATASGSVSCPTGSSSSSSSEPTLCPAASKTPIIVGVIIGVICVLASLAFAAWTWHRNRKQDSESARTWLDGDNSANVSPYRDMSTTEVNRGDTLNLQPMPWNTGAVVAHQMPSPQQEALRNYSVGPPQSVVTSSQSDSTVMSSPSQAGFAGHGAFGADGGTPGASADRRIEVAPAPPRYDFKINNA